MRAEDISEKPRRQIRIDGVDQPQMALAERLAVSWLTPEMDDVLASSASERRRFLDRLVIAFDPAHTGRLQRYEKAARQRNRLLDDKIVDDHWFDALEVEMASSGVAIIAARKALVEALDQEAALPVPAFPSARLVLEGAAEDWLDNMPAVDVEDRLREEARVWPASAASVTCPEQRQACCVFFIQIRTGSRAFIDRRAESAGYFGHPRPCTAAGAATGQAACAAPRRYRLASRPLPA